MEESERRLLVRSNYGRALGWHVWASDKLIATLSDATREDMFWYRYKVEAHSPEAYEPERWWDGSLEFRNRGTEQIARGAFVGGDRPTLESPFVLMRALYIPTKLSWAERLVDYWR